MKKETVAKLLMILVLAVAVVMTSPKKESTNQASKSKKLIKIGILQLTEHPALDAAKQGFIDGLAANGFVEGKNIQIDFLNAQADQSNLKVMSGRLVSEESDLILAIATPAAQALANETKKIPILTTAVTDLVGAKLAKSNEKPGTNVSGTSDMSPIKEQVALLKQLVPNAKTIGFLYNSSEDNSKLQVEIAEKSAKELGYSTKSMTVTNTNDVAQTMEVLAAQVDALYIPTDNTLASAMATVGKIAKEKKIPVITGESNMTMEGGLATVGIDYYKLGQQTAKMAVQVLSKKVKVQNLPVQTQSDPQVVINKMMAEVLGITVPNELKSALKEGK
ncbi:MAG: transporter substrate binding protein [Bacillales bacterium]|jgi:putative ABC transport system substrate-binding protein|nr:transporter substrate binding protein [Bacillales bacterium]